MNLQNIYLQQVKEKLALDFNYKNLQAIPKVEKVIISIGLGEATVDGQVIEKVQQQLDIIAGQKSVPTHAKKAISSFKLREGQPIGLKVTLRGKRMYDFLQKLFSIVLPRIRDFQGVPLKGFDNFGNYNLGFSELIVFPEVDFAKLDKARGLQITIVTTAKNKEEAKRLLELLGMPFRKEVIR